MSKKKRNKRIIGVELVVMLIAIIAVLGIAMLANQIANRQSESLGLSAELARTKAYDRVEEGDKVVEGTDNVKFDAFFLRDLDGNGYATGVRGTCKEIGNQDTLYMELNVQTAGALKDAKITIDGKNFYLQTALPKDEQLANSYIGNNIKEIEFNELVNGTQKLITGIVRSGDYTYNSSKVEAIGNNKNNYSREDNKIILTGTYVGEDGSETPIKKEINFTIDWYGKTKSIIYTKAEDKTSTTINKDIEDTINEEEGTISLEFGVYTEETVESLILKSNHLEGTIPELNGYAPLKVEYMGTNAIFNYNQETRIFTIDRESTEGENGEITNSLSRINKYDIRVIYPLEAYQTLGTETIQLNIVLKTYYEGYNNANAEFANPYKSNVAQEIIVANYKKCGTSLDITIGKYIYNTIDYRGRYVISKQKPSKIYRGQSEKEENDTYKVKWTVEIGEQSEGIIIKETETDKFIKINGQEESAEDIVSNIGIYFIGASIVLGEEGWINVYDDETGSLLVTFTRNNWNKYNENNPYKYEMPVKHIRLETSNITKNNEYLDIYNIKEIDDEKITQKYTKEEFEELQYISSTVEAYLGESQLGTDTHQAYYEEPTSVATIAIDKNAISTQNTEQNAQIRIETKTEESQHRVSWTDGEFLVKLPKEIIDIQVNNISINNSNVKIENYEIIEQDDGIFIKIITKNITPQNYIITIDVDLTSDPRISTTTKKIELYATNENGSDYYYKTNDTYDVNNNLDMTEQVNYTTTNISMVSPNSLLTNQIASNYDENKSTVVSPQVANIRPTYAVIDKEEQIAKIGIQLKNNYASTVSEIQILGKIPFEGNTYTINGKDLGSTFTTTMTNSGIEIPEELVEIAKVYYSENENPSKDITDEINRWKTAEEIEDWDNIKTFLIDLGDYVMPIKKELVFNYIVQIPKGLKLNEISYSHHAVYFCLDTEQGKYRTQIEPNKLGFRIAEKYDLEIQKYQTGRDKLVAGATYSVTEIIENEDGTETKGKSKTAVTNNKGILAITNLYVGEIYEIKEIKTPDDYELNPEVIRLISNSDENGILTISKIEGMTKGDIAITKEEGEKYKVVVKVEDEVKATLKITKKEKNTENKVPYTKYKITGYNLPETGKTVTTDINGEANIKGLTINQEYILTEVKAVEGYYINGEPITFKIVNNEGTYELELTSGTVKENNIVEENSIPTLNITLEDEKIPTYNLEITKVKRTTDVNLSSIKTEGEITEEITYLAGAKFKLYKDNKEIGEYISNENGKILINNLYQYVENKDENAIYTLKEVLAPEGYAKVKDIIFKVQNQDGLKFINIEEKESKYTVEGNTVKLTIEDSPSFKLIKKDGETGELLANIKFAIYNVDEGEKSATNSKGEILGTKENINGREYYTLTTDSNGVITVDLPEGLYKAVEVEAPDKYDISSATYYFGIGGSREGKESLQGQWGKAIEGIEYKNIKSSKVTKDGGYIVLASFTDSITLENGEVINSKGENDGIIFKYDNQGNLEWKNTIRGSSDDNVKGIIEVQDGGYIVIGDFRSESIDLGSKVLTNHTSGDNWDIMLIKYTLDGEVEWAKAIGGDSWDILDKVSETEDNECIIIGHFWSSRIELDNEHVLQNKGNYDIGIAKFDIDGNVKCAKTIGGSGSEFGVNCVETKDNGFITIGTCQSQSIELENGQVLSNNSNECGIVVKHSEDGSVEWGKAIEFRPEEIIETSDGGYLIKGTFYSESVDLENGEVLNKLGSSVVIIKLNSSGEIMWGKTTGENAKDKIGSIISTSDGGFIMGGEIYSRSVDFGNGVELKTVSYDNWSNGMIVKFDSNGRAEWGRVIETQYYAHILSIIETEDKGYIIGGSFWGYDVNLGNGIQITINDREDSMIIKYNSEGIAQWAKVISGTGDDKITCITENENKEYTILIEAHGTIKLENGTVLNNHGDSTGMIIKYKMTDVPEVVMDQAKVIGGSDDDYITCIEKTSDGGYIVGGNFYSSRIDLENGVVLKNGGGIDGMIIKYNKEGKVEWGKVVGGNGHDYINCIIETSDGGYLVGGYFASGSINFGNGVVINTNGNSDGMIIKYDEEGNVEWGKAVGGSNHDYINSIIETQDGGYLVGGCFVSSSIDLGNGVLLNSNGGQDGMLIKYGADGEVEWGKVVGGISSDKINCIAETQDGGYIVGGYFNSSSIDLGNGVLLNSNGGQDGMLIKYGADGEVEWGKAVGGSDDDQITCIIETTDGGYLVGGNFYSSRIDLGNGEVLSNNSSYDGMIIKYDASGNAEWGKAAGGVGTDYINCITETQDGGYLVGGEFYSSSIDLGNGEVLSNNGRYEGMIIKYDASGNVERGKAVGGDGNDRINCITETLSGGYIVGGYFSSNSIDLGEEGLLNNNGGNDAMILNLTVKMGVPEIQELVVKNERKQLKIKTTVKEIDGIKGGSISGENSTTYEKIKYGDNNTKEIVITPEENYEIIGITVNGKEHQFIANSDGTYTMPKFEEVTEDKNIEVIFALKDNKITIKKVDSKTKLPLARAKFKIEKIVETEENEDYIEVETNSEGQASYQIPFGKYRITEIQAPEGYVLDVEPIEIDFTADGIHEFTIENEKYSKVIVNHYKAIKNTDGSYKYTEEKLVESQIMEGKTGENYTSIPYLDLNKYELIKDANGEYIIPSNATGEFTEEITINYYYEEKEIPLIVHHYIEGTTQRVPLKNGTEAEDVKILGKENSTYITTAITDENLSEQYEIAQIPDNAKGVYTGEEVIVTYYYKKVRREVTINKYSEDGITPLEGVKFEILEIKSDVEEMLKMMVISPQDENKKVILTTDAQGKIIIELGVGTYTIVEIETIDGYQLPKETRTELTITKETEALEIDVTNNKKRGEVITHHYLEGTEERVVEDVSQIGIIGEIFATKVSENVPTYYECVGSSEKTSGEYTEEIQEVIYYYKLKEYNYTVEYYYDGEKDEKETETSKKTYGEQVKGYESKVKDGYKFEKEENGQLIITENEETNVIKVYYVKRQDLSYTVNYLEKESNKVISTQEVVENQVFESTIKASDEVITIEGYNYDSSDKESIIIGTTAENNVINLYYTKRTDLRYTVNYLEKDTDKVLSEQKVEENQLFESVIKAKDEVITIDGYNYDSCDKDEITITSTASENVINLYYTKRTDLSYTINYLEKDTNKVLSIQKVAENQVFESVIKAESEVITIDGYNYDSSDKERITIEVDESKNVINLYYTRCKDLKYTVNYLDEDTNEELHEPKVVEEQEYKKVITASKEIIDIEGYEYSSVDKDSITLEIDENENVINIYYIKRSDLSYTVNYLEKDTDKELHKSKIAEGQVFGGIITSKTETIEIEGYKFDSYNKESITIQVDKTKNVINIYYTKRTDIKYKVEYYYDRIKDEDETEEYDATYQDTIEEYEDKIKENYVLVEEKGIPLTIETNESKNIIQIYYATKAKATVKYLNKVTNEIIEEETEEGYVGKEFETEAKDFEGYILVEEPEEKVVLMEEDEVILRYYYIYVSKGVIEKHIDIDTDEILYNTTYEGNEGEEYKTEPKEFEGYDFIEDKYPENAEGTMEKGAITVTYYYKKKESITITVKYIDKETNEEITDQITITDYKGEEYKTEQKEIEGYEFVEVVGETEGELTEDKEVIYYYQKEKEPEIPGEGGDDPSTDNPSTDNPSIDEEQKQPELKDPTATDKEIPSAGLTKEQIAIIVVTVMSVITVILTVIAIKGTILSKKYKK